MQLGFLINAHQNANQKPIGSAPAYRVVWTPDPSGRARKGLGNNLARKCLERWNAAVGVDEGKNAFQPTGIRVLLMTGSEYTVEHRNFENWSST